MMTNGQAVGKKNHDGAAIARGKNRMGQPMTIY
jgi:hypothetical protein